MYSRNYGRGDTSAKITPPPAYSGSAIQGGKAAGEGGQEGARPAENAFAPFSQSIPFPKSGEEQACAPPEEHGCAPPAEEPCREKEGARKEKGSLLSSFLPDLSTEDLILIGILIALAFDLADRDILLVALVVAVVIM